MTPERRKELFSAMATWIQECISDNEEEYNVFKNSIGFTDKELAEEGMDYKFWLGKGA